MTKQSEYFKKILCKDELPEENDTWYDTCSYRATGRYLHSLRGRGIDIPEYFYKPIPSQPVLSFEEFKVFMSKRIGTYPLGELTVMQAMNYGQMYDCYLIGCNQPPLEGDVKDASPPTVEHLNELYELSDEPTIQGNEFYLRGFKDRETWQTKPVEGDVRELNKIIEDVLDKFDNSSLSDLVPSRLLKISKAGRIVDALLSKFKFTRKG